MSSILMSYLKDQHEIPGSRGEANFVWKCRLCQVGSQPPLKVFLPRMNETNK